jgi:maleate isomerase
VLFWHALHLAGAGEAALAITGYGRLFRTTPGNSA